MKQYSEEEILTLLTTKDAVNLIRDGRFYDVILNRKKYQAQYLNFTGCLFAGRFDFQDLNLSYGLKFTDCEFLEEVNFREIIVDRFDRRFNRHSESLTFTNCKFHKRINFLHNSKVHRAVIFEHCIFEMGVTIDHLEIENEGLEFDHCTVRQRFDLSRLQMRGDVKFSHSNIECDCRISDSALRAIWYSKGNHFSGTLRTTGCKIVESIVYSQSKFSEILYLTDNQFEKDGYGFQDCTFDKAIILSYHSGHLVNRGLIQAIRVQDSIFSGGFEITGAEPEQKKPMVRSITINASSVLKGSINVSGLDIGYLLLTGHNSSANFHFRDITVNQFLLQGLINEGGLIFSGVSASANHWTEINQLVNMEVSSIQISESNLGKMQIFQSDLRSFERINIYNVILTDISTSMVNWFSHEQLENGKVALFKKRLKLSRKAENSAVSIAVRADFLIFLNSLREIYRQLKFAAQKQGDTPQSLKFQYREMKYYYLINKYRKPRQWSEYLILWSNQSNRYGQSWLRAFRWLVGFSFLAYLPIGYLSSPIINYNQWADGTSDIFLGIKVILWDNLKTWLVLMNPAHRMTDISSHVEKFSPWLYFWDLVSRIVVSYFIFQMVSAFRKFSR